MKTTRIFFMALLTFVIATPGFGATMQVEQKTGHRFLRNGIQSTRLRQSLKCFEVVHKFKKKLFESLLSGRIFQNTRFIKCLMSLR